LVVRTNATTKVRERLQARFFPLSGKLDVCALLLLTTALAEAIAPENEISSAQFAFFGLANTNGTTLSAP
jgi:hypothetical protein